MWFGLFTACYKEKRFIMSNLFKALQGASDSDFKNQIAVYKVATIGNIMKLQSNKMYKGVTDTIDYIANIFTDIKIGTTAPKEIDTQIKEYADSLNGRSREELKIIFVNSIKERLGVNQRTSLEKLSIIMVDKAAEHLEISKILNPAQKIDAVYQRYSERIEELARKQYEKASDEEKAQIRKKIDESLESLSDAERKQIQDALKVDTITSDTVISMMKTTGITGAAVVGGSMFGSYILLTVLLHGVFTTLLGITLPFAVYTGATSALSFITGPVGWAAFAAFGVWQYLSGSSKVDAEIICQTIFLARHLNKVPFNPADDDLPSWINPKDSNAIETRKKADLEHKEKIAELKRKEDELAKQYKKYNETEKRIEQAYEQLEKEQRNLAIAEEKLAKFEKLEQIKNDEITELKRMLNSSKFQDNKSEEEIVLLRNKINEKNKALDEIKSNYNKAQKFIKEFTERENNINKIIDDCQNEYEKVGNAEYSTNIVYNQMKEELFKITQKREQEFTEGVRSIIAKDNKRKYRVHKEFVNGVASLVDEYKKEVFRIIIQIRESTNPADIGYPAEVINEYKIPTFNGDYWLIYFYDSSERRVDFKRFGNKKILEEISRNREENKKLKLDIERLRANNGELVAKLQQRSNNTPIKNQEIKSKFDKALNEACVELDIFSPWLGYGVINASFKKKIERLLSKNVVVKIRYGIGADGNGQSVKRDENTQKIARDLKQRFGKYANFKMEKNNSHAKLLICDDKFYVITSYNFLSFNGDYSSSDTRGEIGEFSDHRENIIEYRKEYFSF